MNEGTWTLRPCPRQEVEALSRALEISEVTARVLVRRGYGDPEAARAFLAADDPGHDPFTLGAMDAACTAIREAIGAGRRICVHGDYDVDGICATAVAVLALRAAGADADWFLPSRFEEGYGLSREAVERIAGDGYGMLLTVDCGITAVEEVAYAKELGLRVVVTDHHRPGPLLPDCPVVAPRPSSYPFPELCGTGVVFKLAQALGHADERLLDLVALATVADVVPLVDENRSLVVRGLRLLARTERPGVRALMAAARVDAATLDAGSIGFRLAPRINAAGRLCHPSTALRLLLTESDEEARTLAAELEALNRDRQAVEERILRDAIRQVEEWPEPARRRSAYVLWGEDWHQGVIGIVASRLVERYHRPVVLVAGGEDVWKGSGRSIHAFDLHAGLAACSASLEGFGGHRAAAGLTIRPARLNEFAEALAAHADGRLAEDDLRPTVHVDAVVRGDELTLDLCQDLERLAPFGLGNPDVTLLVPACELSELNPVGEGRHLRLAVTAGGVRSGAIAFGQGAQLDRFRHSGPWDVAFRLHENRWNGTVSPQLVVRRVFATPEAYAALRERFAAEWRAGPQAWSAEALAVFEELAIDPASPRRVQLLESERFRELLAQTISGGDVELRAAA